MRDYFHMKQANMRKLQKIGLSHLRFEVGQDISVLWHADTKEDFNDRLDVFLDKWDRTAPHTRTTSGVYS
jgi:hypothetical protein